MIKSVFVTGLLVYSLAFFVSGSEFDSLSGIFRIANRTECKMYQKHCFIKITSKNLINFANMKPEKSKIFEYRSIKKCSINDTKVKECSKFRNYISLNGILYLLDIKPKLVGRAILELEYWVDNSSIAFKKVHNVVIKSPKRFIDIFQIFYISIVSALVSVIMGVLLDMESLIQIIKMPITVLIGFVAQYLFMPLVNLLNFNYFSF